MSSPLSRHPFNSETALFIGGIAISMRHKKSPGKPGLFAKKDETKAQ
jgi:hypothetical protein